MKAETDPITEDEWLLRLVWRDRMRRLPLSPHAFEPRGDSAANPDTDGINLYREACLNDPRDVLAVIVLDKRSSYGIVRVPIKLLTDLRLTARPDPDPRILGHVVIPEICSAAYKDSKMTVKELMARLAEVASGNVVLQLPET